MSRGGDKLAGALERFDIAVEGARCLDAGASTGGFTDALLQAGAAHVLAVDVGRHQLHERLRGDPRVDSREQTDIRSLQPGECGPVDLAVVDLSFISLRSVLDPVVALLRPAGDLVVLVKPQFEAGRVEASRGRGIIRDPEIWQRVLGDVLVALDASRAAIMDAMVSPLRGTGGNVEFLVHARKRGTHGGPVASEIDLAALVATADEDR